MHGVLFLYVFYFIPRTQMGWVQLARLPSGRVLCTGPVTPVGGSFAPAPQPQLQPIFFSPNQG